MPEQIQVYALAQVIPEKMRDVLKGDFYVRVFAASNYPDDRGDELTETALQCIVDDSRTFRTVLLNHSQDRPIGRIEEAKIVERKMRVGDSEVTVKGVEQRIFISSAEPEIRIKIAEGVISMASIFFFFDPTAVSFNESQGRLVRVINKLSFRETSLVSIPMNPTAQSIGWHVKKALDAFEAGDSEPTLEEVLSMAEEIRSEELMDASPEEEQKSEEIEVREESPEQAQTPQAESEPQEKANPCPEDEEKEEEEEKQKYPYPYPYPYKKGQLVCPACGARLVVLAPKKKKGMDEEDLEALSLEVSELKSMVEALMEIVEAKAEEKSEAEESKELKQASEEPKEETEEPEVSKESIEAVMKAIARSMEEAKKSAPKPQQEKTEEKELTLLEVLAKKFGVEAEV